MKKNASQDNFIKESQAEDHDTEQKDGTVDQRTSSMDVPTISIASAVAREELKSSASKRAAMQKMRT